jgi:uncharacterized membrane protein YjjB (DUF3815 family)
MMWVLREALLAFVATIGFAVLFNVPRRSLWACGLVGMAGHLVDAWVLHAGASPAGAAFAGAAAVGALGELFAYLLHLPATTFIVTGFIPLIPGVAAAKAMIAFLREDYQSGAASAVRATLSSAAIAAGIGSVGVVARGVRQWRREA